jgi:predicted aminopeptidase
LSNKEEALLSFFQSIDRPFYIIGTSDDNKSLASTVRHELGHALFYLNDDYREEVRAALATVPTKKIGNFIRRMGYHESSVEDETHAYLLDPLSYLVSEAGIDPDRYQNVHRRLLNLFKKYYGTTQLN